MMLLLAGTSLLGTIINIWLYIDDKKNRGGVLDMVHGKESVTGVIKGMDDLPVTTSFTEVPGTT